MRTLVDVHGRAADFKLGRLSPDEQREFIDHVAECDDCAQTLKLLEDVEAAATAPAHEHGGWWGHHGPSNTHGIRLSTQGFGARATHGLEGERARYGVPRRSVLAIAAVAVIAAFAFSTVSKAVQHPTYVHGFTSVKTAQVALKLQGKSAELLTVGMPQAPRGYRYAVYRLAANAHNPAPTGAYLHVNTLGEGGVTIPGGASAASVVALYEVPAPSTHSALSATPTASDTPLATVNVPAQRGN